MNEQETNISAVRSSQEELIAGLNNEYIDRQRQLESSYLSKEQLVVSFKKFLLNNPLIDDHYRVDRGTHQKVLEWLHLGISPIFALAYDKRIARVIDNVRIEEALKFIPILSTTMLKNPEYFSELLNLLTEQDTLQQTLEKYKRRKSQIQINLEHSQLLNLKPQLKQWDIEYAKEPFTISFPPKLQPPEIKILRSYSPHSVLFNWGPQAKELVALDKFYSQYSQISKLSVQKNPFPTDTIIPATSYVDRKSASLNGVGVIYKIDKIYAAYPTDISSNGVNEYKSKNSNFPQVTNWNDLKKLSSSEFGIRLNEYFYYPELWISGVPLEIFVRPYDSLVSRSKGNGQADDENRALAAISLSQTLDLPVKILR